jgi:methylglyoxal synthase
MPVAASRESAEFNRDLLARHGLYATGATGRILGEELGCR